jgi:hypothetical protein
MAGLVDPSQYDQYTKFADLFVKGSEYETITWEAHEVTLDTGYIKTMFRLTGDTSDPNWVADK